MKEEEILNIVKNQRDFFKTGKTKDVKFRFEQLKKLQKAVELYEEDIVDALNKDLGRCEIDCFVGDLMPLKKAIEYSLKNLKNWVKPEKVKTMAGTKGYIVSEPLGCVLIISPWNYPALLALEPMVAAIAAGNCIILKPSELSTNISALLSKMLSETFSSNFVKVIEGAVEETTYLLKETFDHVFFTGSTMVGKIVYEAAAKNLTPVTLELGGKSPVIVDKNIDFKIAAKRLIWGKLLNNGQTCVAPDYAFIHKKIKNEFVLTLIETIKQFYGENPQNSKFYSRIINKKNFERVKSYLDSQNIIYGGKSDESDLYIEPTLINSPPFDSPIMQNEIFGPLLPVFEYTSVQEAIDFINSRPNPLALYVFSKNKQFCENVISQTSSGGMSINDTIMHLTPETLPFGGVGSSGIGRYHGKAGFDTFSNKRSVLKNTYLFDRDILYPPYKLSFEQIKMITKFF